jgi:hypothetical protein
MLLGSGLSHKVLIRFSSFWDFAITIESLCFVFLKLLVLCLCLPAKANLLFGVLSSSARLMRLSLVCVPHLPCVYLILV